MPKGMDDTSTHLSRRLANRQVALLASAISLIGVLVVFLPVSLLSLYQVVGHSEVLDTEKEVARAHGVIDNELSQLAKTNQDYAYWDDTYRFIQEGNPEYIELNLHDEALVNLGVNFVAAIDNAGQMRALKIVDLVEGVERQAPFDFDELLRRYPTLLQDRSRPAPQRGIAVIGDLAMLVSSYPVLDSLKTEPSAGALIMGVYLDVAKVERLSALAQKDIRLWLAGSSSLPDVPEARQTLGSSGGKYTQVMDGASIAGYLVLDDLGGHPALVMQVLNPRTLRQQGDAIAARFLAVFMALSLAVAVAVFWLVLAYLNARRSKQQALERFEAVFNQSNDAILLTDEHWRILDANSASLRMLKLGNKLPRDVSLDDLVSLEAKSSLSRSLILGQGSSPISELSCHLSDGTRLELEVSVSTIQDTQASAYCVIIRDITARKEAQRALQASEERYRLAAQGANDGLWDWDIQSNQVYYSPRWKAMLGYTNGELSGSLNEWLDRLHPDDRIPFKAKLDEYLSKRGDHFEYEHRVLHQDGAYRWVLSRGAAVWSSAGFAQRMAGSLTDITRQKEIEEQLRFDALHDKLTGLGNRTLLVERLKYANQRMMRNPDARYAVLFLDLDRFKLVNDTYGHQVGDLILIEAARRLESNLRAVDAVARAAGPETLVRVAGDEFVVLLDDLREPQDAERVAQRVLHLLAQPYTANGVTINLSASIGVVVADRVHERPEDVIREADIAMYQAKQKGGNTAVLFTPAMYEVVSARIQLETELRRAVENREFVLHYQPIYALDDDSVIGFEALVRWNHPARGLLAPAEFLELAEDTGLIVPMGYDVLRQACAQVKRWQNEYALARQMIVSVNLSARQLAAPDLIAYITSTLADLEFDPRSLWLEITETTLIEKLDQVRHVLVELRKMGIHIEIDDFGVGYSSLSYLHHLPIDGFKIDQSFINEITGEGQQIVNTLVDLGRNLRLVQIAEGVETIVQRDYLRQLSCEYMQGYLMARPMSAERVESFLRELKAGRGNPGLPQVCSGNGPQFRTALARA